MRRLLAVVLMFGLLGSQLWAQVPQTTTNEPLLGFTAQSSADERAWEEKFKTIPNPKLMRDYMQRLSARPHHVGSPYDKDNAEWILAQLQVVGMGREDRAVRRAVPDAEDRAAGDDRADALHGKAGRAGAGRRSDEQSERRAAADL